MFFDELDVFLEGFRSRVFDPKTVTKEEEEDIIDELLDLYLLAYFEGSQEAARALMVDIEPDVEAAKESIDKKIDGKDYKDRVREYLHGEMGETTGTPAEAIARVADTDAVRIFNEGGMDAAIAGGAMMKTWRTMEDEKVRDTHRPLDGVSSPIDGYFYTYDGDKASAPGQFSKAQNNVNCRCQLEFSK